MREPRLRYVTKILFYYKTILVCSLFIRQARSDACAKGVAQNRLSGCPELGSLLPNLLPILVMHLIFGSFSLVSDKRRGAMRTPKITQHARQRLQQRGARAKEVAIIMAHGDIEVPARQGCRFIQLSHLAAASLLLGGDFRAQEIDRAKRLTVLASPTDHVVTVIKCDPEQRFRRGRRNGFRR